MTNEQWQKAQELLLALERGLNAIDAGAVASEASVAALQEVFAQSSSYIGATADGTVREQELNWTIAPFAEWRALVSGFKKYILNGTNAQNEYPYCVAVQSLGMNYECSGVLVHPEYAITVEHCAKPSRIFIGNNTANAQLGLNEFKVSTVGVVHGHGGAVKILKLASAVSGPFATLAATCKFQNSDGVIVGFGLGSFVGSPGVKRFGNVFIEKWDPIVTIAKPASPCRGDSGGPLIANKMSKDVVCGLIEQAGGPNCVPSSVAYTMLDETIVGEIEKKCGVMLQRCS